LLDKKGITPYRLAKDIGICQMTLSQWKNGRSTPKVDKLQKIADYFGVTIDYLLNGKENSK